MRAKTFSVCGTKAMPWRTSESMRGSVLWRTSAWNSATPLRTARPPPVSQKFCIAIVDACAPAPSTYTSSAESDDGSAR